ncbi:hypothetical protein TNCT_186701 [Trichonephila clavata]|uniref:Secreted protein n=1 Tax=Trichonephila clavata TaxID=2740835 RepID=A0A8X6L916_TRICU|nr:hypothetical protein TNCT_186701 [Trichonephila clavata]
MQSTHLFLAVLFDGQLLLDPDGGPLPSQPGLSVHVHRHSRNSQVWHPRMGFAIVLYYSMDYCESHLRRCVSIAKFSTPDMECTFSTSWRQ